MSDGTRCRSAPTPTRRHRCSQAMISVRSRVRWSSASARTRTWAPPRSSECVRWSRRFPPGLAVVSWLPGVHALCRDMGHLALLRASLADLAFKALVVATRREGPMMRRHRFGRTVAVLMPGLLALGMVGAFNAGSAAAAVSPAPYNGPPSTVGTDFWTAFGVNEITGTDYIDLSGNTATTATVAVPGASFTQDVSITPGSVTAVTVTGADLSSTDGTQNLGVHITAGAPVSVYGLEDSAYTTDGFTAIPVTAIGSDYYALGFDNATHPGAGPSDLQVVGTQNGTTVTITPSQNTASRTAGVPY